MRHLKIGTSVGIAVAGWLLAGGHTLAATHVSFEGPDAITNWLVESGDWKVSDGTLVCSSAERARSMIWRPETAYANVDVSVKFNVEDFGQGVRAPGLVYRAVGIENYYYVHFDLLNQQVVWARSEKNREWALDRRQKVDNLTPATWHTARVVAAGNHHEIYLDGTLLISVNDDRYPVGIIGLRDGQGKMAFKDLVIDGTEAVLDPPFKVPEPRFSLVCTNATAGAYEAFPDVCRAASGELLCVFYAGDNHVTGVTDAYPRAGRICMVRSQDNGVTWSDAEVVVDSVIDDRDSSIAQLKDGRLVVSYMTLDYKRKPATHAVFLVWSSDGGKTWGEPQPIETPLKGNEAVSEPVRELADGTLLLPLYGKLNPEEKYSVAVMISHDGGKTWPEHSMVTVPGEDLLEPSVVQLPDDRILMFIRPRILWCESTDGGRSWSQTLRMPVAGDAPCAFLTSKNILLLSFRHYPTRSTAMVYSRDFGKTWSAVEVIDRVIGAYPSMTELPDGRILVVYYTEGYRSDIRCSFIKADEKTVEVLPRAKTER